jgi:hypothetical protein
VTKMKMVIQTALPLLSSSSPVKVLRSPILD